MTSLTMENISTLFDSHLSEFFDSKLSSQTDSLKTSISQEIEAELSKELDPTIRNIDLLAERLGSIEERLNHEERIMNSRAKKTSKEDGGGGNQRSVKNKSKSFPSR